MTDESRVLPHRPARCGRCDAGSPPFSCAFDGWEYVHDLLVCPRCLTLAEEQRIVDGYVDALRPLLAPSGHLPGGALSGPERWELMLWLREHGVGEEPGR